MSNGYVVRAQTAWCSLSRDYARPFGSCISAWASSLLVPTRWAMRRPQSVGRAASTDSHAFFILPISHLYIFRKGAASDQNDINHGNA